MDESKVHDMNSFINIDVQPKYLKWVNTMMTGKGELSSIFTITEKYKLLINISGGGRYK
ncbi:unnamed protein product [Paramecium sonneborni]|uniref:Uncharacterized protein n=1 Tax=Paramecium sonneborni TaxID=65129 RepID=A0A8S1QB48_9CILI|nr:unnamed protein product [Paramecium sonneborni]